MRNTAVYKQAGGFTTEFEDMGQVQKDIVPRPFPWTYRRPLFAARAGEPPQG